MTVLNAFIHDTQNSQSINHQVSDDIPGAFGMLFSLSGRCRLGVGWFAHV